VPKETMLKTEEKQMKLPGGRFPENHLMPQRKYLDRMPHKQNHLLNKDVNNSKTVSHKREPAQSEKHSQAGEAGSNTMIRTPWNNILAEGSNGGQKKTNDPPKIKETGVTKKSAEQREINKNRRQKPSRVGFQKRKQCRRAISMKKDVRTDGYKNKNSLNNSGSSKIVGQSQ